MHRPSLIPLFTLAHTAVILAATVTYNWEVTWVWAAPDGFWRPVIGINNSWPCPIIEASVGDTVVVNLLNKLGNETTGMHFHGINQINSNAMDGSVGSCQCPLPPNYSITYSFTVRQRHAPNRLHAIENTLIRSWDRPTKPGHIGVNNSLRLVFSIC